MDEMKKELKRVSELVAGEDLIRIEVNNLLKKTVDLRGFAKNQAEEKAEWQNKYYEERSKNQREIKKSKEESAEEEFKVGDKVYIKIPFKVKVVNESYIGGYHGMSYSRENVTKTPPTFEKPEFVDAEDKCQEPCGTVWTIKELRESQERELSLQLDFEKKNRDLKEENEALKEKVKFEKKYFREAIENMKDSEAEVRDLERDIRSLKTQNNVLAETRDRLQETRLVSADDKYKTSHGEVCTVECMDFRWSEVIKQKSELMRKYDKLKTNFSDVQDVNKRLKIENKKIGEERNKYKEWSIIRLRQLEQIRNILNQ